MTKKYVQRSRFYSEFNNFNSVMINQVNFQKKTLINVLNEYEKNDFIKYISEYCINNSKVTLSYLNSEDIKSVDEYCDLLGRSDQQTQNKHLIVYEKIIQDKLKYAKEEEREKKNLYLKMGLMIGLILFIIII